MSRPRSTPRPRLLSSLRWRLSIAMSGVILLCAGACVAGAVLFLHRALTDRASSDLQRTINGVSHYLSDQRADLLGAAKLIAIDPQTASAVARGDHQFLTVHLIPFYADLGYVDTMDVIDTHGRVLVRMEDTSAYGDTVGTRSSIQAALRGRQQVTFEPVLARSGQADIYARLAFVPIRSGGQVVGALALGRQLNNIFATRIGNALSASVNLIAGGQRTGTTLTDEHGLPVSGLPASTDVLHRIAANRTDIIQAREDGQESLSGLVLLRGANHRAIGAVEVVRALGAIYDLVTQLSFLLIALGAVVVVVGTLLALDVGRRLTSRLEVLETVASRVAGVASRNEPLHNMRGAVLVRGDDEIASLAASFSAMMTALDDRIEANDRLYAEAQARVRDLTGLAEIARLTARESVRETLHLLAEHVCRLVGCPAVAIWLPGDSHLQELIGGHGLPEDYERIMQAVQTEGRPSGHQTAAHTAFRAGEIAWLPLDSSAEGLSDAHKALRRTVAALGWVSVTAVPLRVQDRIVGTLSCYSTEPVMLPDEDQSLLTTIADQVAVAVENSRLYARSRDLAALDERARLARELHDSVTQALFSMNMHAGAAKRMVEQRGIDGHDPLGRNLDQLSELTQTALAEMRALIFELRPGSLAEEGLIEALRKQAAALSARETLRIEVSAPRERPVIPAEMEEHLYRVAQEALHNIVKHADAHHATIRLEVESEPSASLVLEIQDDGAGFDTEAVGPGHMGLGTMIERIHRTGGHLQIVSAPGQGTIVRAVIPANVLQQNAQLGESLGSGAA